MARRKPPRGLSDAAFNRWLRKERERCKWDWTLDFTQVKTKTDFVQLIAEHVRERVRLGMINKFELPASLGPRFWYKLDWTLGCYFGGIHIRCVGWPAFSEQQKDLAKKLQLRFQLLRRERGASDFKVEYDSAAGQDVRFRTYIRYLFLGPTCKLTVPALVQVLREYPWKEPVSVRSVKWRELTFDDINYNRVRQLKNKDGLELNLGGNRLQMLCNDNIRQVTQLREVVAESAWHDPEELKSCRRILEIWSWDADPKGKLSKQRQAVLGCIEKAFSDVYLEDDDALAE